MTSFDIKNQEFKKVFRGYDPDDVMSFLEHVAAE
ncbi:MAG: DivIVA domain-containing protein, partial [Ignavibacteriales bacterium]|nr:DivIVA domain-containing protein [Ignavibacteriales bacterium]